MSKIYIVCRKYYIRNLSDAFQKAKEILRKRALEHSHCALDENKWKITLGKKKGWCVASLDDWQKVGNSNLLRVIIQEVKLAE